MVTPAFDTALGLVIVQGICQTKLERPQLCRMCRKTTIMIHRRPLQYARIAKVSVKVGRSIRDTVFPQSPTRLFSLHHLAARRAPQEPSQIGMTVLLLLPVWINHFLLYFHRRWPLQARNPYKQTASSIVHLLGLSNQDHPWK